VFEGLRARLDQLLRDPTRSDPRARAEALREAVLEARLGLDNLRRALATSERELAGERRHLADAERRGRLAAQVPDPETVAVAERFVVRHRERILVLERKLVVQRDELALAERETEEMTVEFRAAAARHPSGSIDAAWRDLESAGAARPSEEEQQHADADRRLREQAVEAQLAYLKKKMGKDRSG